MRLKVGEVARWQDAFLSDPHRFRVLVAGRRSGKTWTAAETVKEYMYDFHRNIMVVAPTLGVVADLYWEEIKDMIPTAMIAKKNEQRKRIQLINGTVIRLRGADSEKSLRGYANDLVILDECQSVGAKVFNQLLLPTLSDRKGKAVICGTSLGRNHFYDLWFNGSKLNPDRNHNWVAYQIDSYRAGILDLDEIENAKSVLPKDIFELEYMASWDSGVGLVYDDFNASVNASDKKVSRDRPLLLGWDFNITPHCLAVCQLYGNELHIVDEISMDNCTTETMCNELVDRYKWFIDKDMMEAFPDTSGVARSTNSSTTDFAIIESFGIRVTKIVKPYIRDRVNAVRARICNALGDRNLFVHPQCRGVIRCFLNQMWADDGKPDKKKGFDHYPDGIGYLIWGLFPLTGHVITQEPGR